MTPPARFRWGILGCAEIASRSVIRGIQTSVTGSLVAIASRDGAKARDWAARYGIPHAHDGYEALLGDPEVDAVYIPLPNHLHREWTLKAAAAGKHVLCEKPFAMDAKQAREMVAGCASHGVHLAEAFMYRHHPRYRKVRELIASGAIGELRGVHGTFTYNSVKRRTENVRWHREMGGGSIYDIGCYPISAARWLVGREPVAATCQALFSPRHDQVDMMASGLVEFPGDVALTFDCGMWAAPRNTLEVLGTDGAIESTSAYSALPDAPSNFFLVKDGQRTPIEVPTSDQYSRQADDFASAARKETPALMPPEDPILNLIVIDACLASAAQHRRVAIPPLSG